jgi:methylase of polypeptide subunit release factors
MCDSWETFYTRSLEHIASKKRADRQLDAENEFTQEKVDGEVAAEKEEEADDDDDPGTSWFSEHDAPLKVLKFLTSRKFPLSPRRQRQQQQQAPPPPSILDLGTGNGSMLAMLRKRGGFTGEMVGVDYSAQSVQLARELQRLKLHSAYESDDDEEESEEEEYEEEHEDVVVASNTGSAEAIPVDEQDIRFEEWDILDPANEDALNLPPTGSTEEEKRQQEEEKQRIPWFPYRQAGFDIVLDKGTFDAVSLSDETTTDKQYNAAEKETKAGKTVQPRICHKYPRVSARLVRPGGFLVVTSCNWTEEELVRWFTATGELSVWDRVEYPRFRFGGHEGQGVCTVCFRRGSQ